LRGEMVGLTTSYAAGADFEASAGFAIPVDERFARTVDVLKRGERPAYGFLGVGSELLSGAARRAGQHGARVVSVVDGTPAARGGIKVGDVITRVNEEPVRDDADLFRIVGALPAGATATLAIARGGDRLPAAALERQVTLTKKYVGSARPQVGRENLATWRGMSVDDSSASSAFGYLGPHLDRQGCVYVAAVDRDSPAWKAGLRPGVFVSRVAGKPVTSPAEFVAAAKAASGPVELVVLTGQGEPTRQTVSP